MPEGKAEASGKDLRGSESWLLKPLWKYFRILTTGIALPSHYSRGILSRPQETKTALG